MLDLVGAPLAVLVVERDKPEALQAMREAADRLGDSRIEFARVPTIYPAGGERQLVEVLTGREVPSGSYPPASKCICHNVGTAYALDRLIRQGEPLTSRIVTVTGQGVANATNVEVPIGTPIREVIEFCGGYRGEVALLILGGNMMGYALPSDDLPVTKAGNCILAAHSDEIRESFGEWPCIRCGDCADVCPARLLPQEILRASRPQDFDRLDALGLDDCIECGCCDVVCPQPDRADRALSAGEACFGGGRGPRLDGGYGARASPAQDPAPGGPGRAQRPPTGRSDREDRQSGPSSHDRCRGGHGRANAAARAKRPTVPSRKAQTGP